MEEIAGTSRLCPNGQHLERDRTEPCISLFAARQVPLERSMEAGGQAMVANLQWIPTLVHDSAGLDLRRINGISEICAWSFQP